ncbi:MAG: amidohydrolase family protein [Steroidobacteraceae bacterium]
MNNLTRSLLPLAVCLAAALAGPVQAADILHAAGLVDVRTGKVLGPSSVRVEDGRITAVEAGHRPPAEGDAVIDLGSCTLLPGLMDMHVHLTSEYSARAELDRYKKREADVALDATVYAERTLLAGFTTVRDLGDSFLASLSLRDAINAGKVAGPRVFAAGKSIATTGGHADPTNGLSPVFASAVGDPGPVKGVCNGAAECAQAVRQRYKDGSDVIKITATGGVLSIARSGQAPQFQSGELEAIIATARDYGFTVAAHAHGTEGMKRAVLAGVNSIEHGTFMDDETMRLMKEKGTLYVPTISAGRWVYEKGQQPGFFPDVVRPKALSIGPQIQDTFARAYRAGVPIMFGTDCGVCEHGTNGREFAYMVEGGMPVMEAIQSATLVPARFLGVTDRLGSIEVGKLADIIAVPGDPTADVDLLGQVAFVMKDGRTYRNDCAALQ